MRVTRVIAKHVELSIKVWQNVRKNTNNVITRIKRYFMFDWVEHGPHRTLTTELNGFIVKSFETRGHETHEVSSFRAKTAGQQASAYTLQWFTLSSNKTPVIFKSPCCKIYENTALPKAGDCTSSSLLLKRFRFLLSHKFQDIFLVTASL